MRNTIQQPEAGRSPASGGSSPSAVDRPATGQVDEVAAAEGRKHERTARPERPAPARDSGELTLAELAWTLVERRWSVIAVGATVLALTVAYLFVAPRVYESSILVQVGGRSQSIAAFQDLAGLFHEQTPTEGEMRILRSRTLLDAVVDQLGLDLEVEARTMPVIGDALARRYEGAAPAPPRFGRGGHVVDLAGED
jgi:hypothetical protein